MGEIEVKASIKELFEKMEYGKDVENLNEVLEWIKTRENKIYVGEKPNGTACVLKNATNNEELCEIYTPDSNTVASLLSRTSNSKNKWFETPAEQKAELLYKFGEEIEKQKNFLVKLECAARGILFKDTETRGLPLLTDFLQYYSSFVFDHNATKECKGLAVAVISDYNALWSLGAFLGPSLASGYRVVLQTNLQLSPIATYLSELAIKIGIPEGTITVIPGNVDVAVFFTSADVSQISIFDEIFKEEYTFANNFNKKLFHFYASGSPMVVFEDSDLDSACHCAIDAAWGYKGMLPWTLRNIFVQENIFEVFIKKLKARLSRIKIGSAGLKNVDLSYPDEKILDKLGEVCEKLRKEGVELWQVQDESNIPCLAIGGNNIPNNVIKEDWLLNVPLVSISSFRTAKEAINLANNTRHGLGVSIWSENTTLINELVGKLKFGNIWINAHGLFNAGIANSAFKASSNGFIGGKEGFYEYSCRKLEKNEITISLGSGTVMEKAIAEAKKVHEVWAKLPLSERQRTLQKLAYACPDKQWSNLIHQKLQVTNGSVISCKNYNIVSTFEPYGVIAIEFSKEKISLIIEALLVGNSVIILTESKDLTFLCNSSLPNNLITIIPNSQDVIKVAALHKELNVYIGEPPNKVFSSLPLKNSNKFKDNKQSHLTKNVWFSKCQSFI